MENDEKNNLIDNKFIVDSNLELLKTCVDMQFRKLCKLDPWKNQFKNDFFNDLVVTLYNYTPEKLNDAYRNNHMNALFTRIILNQIYSKTSAFFNTYLKYPGRALWGLDDYRREYEGETEGTKYEDD